MHIGHQKKTGGHSFAVSHISMEVKQIHLRVYKIKDKAEDHKPEPIL